MRNELKKGDKMASEIIFGTHSVKTALDSSPQRIIKILIEGPSQKRHISLIDQANEGGIKVIIVTREELNQKCRLGNHQGVAAELGPYQYSSLNDFLENKTHSSRVVLILDGVTDPQNLGAILRSAGAFGTDLIILPKDRSAAITPVAAKIASGALDAIPVALETNLVRAIGKLKEAGFWCYALDADGPAALHETDLTGDVVLILGSEGKGVRRLVAEAADSICKIPANGPIPSLNVGAATACALYEVSRQRTLISRARV
jgi:23S rRNA (guanosine2251-2'-O)-methyltransferase